MPETSGISHSIAHNLEREQDRTSYETIDVSRRLTEAILPRRGLARGALVAAVFAAEGMDMNPVGFPCSIEWLHIKELSPYEGNARTHSAKQIRQIARSIEEFGWTNPVLVDEAKGIIAGHGRVLAAKRLGIERVPTLRISNLSPEQKRAYVIADNKLAENAGWDKELLALELGELLEINYDVELTGFETAEVDILLSFDDVPPPDPDDEPLLPESTAVSKPGDIWLLGPHRLLCGSALDASAFNKLLDGKQADLVFTDPPYNVPVKGHVSGLGKAKHREFSMASGELSSLQFTDFLKQSLTLLADNSRDGSIHFICMDWRHVGELSEAGSSAYDELKNICVWTKSNGGMGSLYRSQHELVFVFKKGNAAHINNVELGKHGRYRTNVWSYPGLNSFSEERDSTLNLHPTVKPVALVEDAIKDCSKRGGIVLDSFCGSGTTILAAERCGRVARCIEIDPLYVDVAIRRWQQMTGESAIHAMNGRPFADAAKEASHV